MRDAVRGSAAAAKRSKQSSMLFVGQVAHLFRRHQDVTLTVLPPPQTPVEPVTEMMHGVSITDPYRWLEDQNSPRTREWVETQIAYARSYLDALPGKERIRKRVSGLLSTDIISDPWKVGNRHFFLKRSRGQEQAALMMREAGSALDQL